MSMALCRQKPIHAYTATARNRDATATSGVILLSLQRVRTSAFSAAGAAQTTAFGRRIRVIGFPLWVTADIVVAFAQSAAAAGAAPASVTRRSAGTGARRSRQARRPAKAMAAGIDAASMARRCQSLTKKTEAFPQRMLSAGKPCAARRLGGLFAAKLRRRRPQADGGHERRRVPRVSVPNPARLATKRASRQSASRDKARHATKRASRRSAPRSRARPKIQVAPDQERQLCTCTGAGDTVTHRDFVNANTTAVTASTHTITAPDGRSSSADSASPSA